MTDWRWVVATHGCLLASDHEGRAIEIADGFHYGLSVDWSAREIHSIYGGPTVASREEFELRAYDADSLELKSVTHLSPWFDAVHQVASTGSHLAVVNTRRNALAVLDRDGATVARHQFFGRYRDVNHPNSVLGLSDGYLVLLHNYGRRRSQVVALEFDGERLTPVATLDIPDTMCHNLHVADGMLVYNASPSRSVRELDPATGTRRSLDLGSHAKGLSVDESTYVVGVSDFAERSKRHAARGSLIVVDAASLEVLRSVEIEVEGRGNCGNINEVRSLVPFQERGEWIPDRTVAEVTERWSRLRPSRSDVVPLLKRSFDWQRRDLTRRLSGLPRNRRVGL